MDEKEIAKKIKEGAVLAQVSFEVIGAPKEHVEKSIHDFVDNVRKDKQIHIITEEYGDAEALEGGLFGTFADTELLVESLDKFNWLCVNFMPANIEIIEPAELRFTDKEMTNWFNDLLAKLHEVSTNYRKLATKEDAFVKNMNALMHNTVLLAAEHHHTVSDISQRTGIPEKEIEKLIEINVKNGKLEKRENQYFRK
jgi:hypothetical protein